VRASTAPPSPAPPWSTEGSWPPHGRHGGAGGRWSWVAGSTDTGGSWRYASAVPTAGEDLTLPALAHLPAGGLILVVGVHGRAHDALGYDWLTAALPRDEPPRLGAVRTVVPPIPGPGFYELGESLSAASQPGAVLSGVTVGGPNSSGVEVASWSLPVSPSRQAGVVPAARARPSPSKAGWTWLAAAGADMVGLATEMLWIRRRRRR